MTAKQIEFDADRLFRTWSGSKQDEHRAWHLLNEATRELADREQTLASIGSRRLRLVPEFWYWAGLVSIVIVNLSALLRFLTWLAERFTS